MPKKEIIKPKKKVEPVDFFYQSKYTANNVIEFMEIWQNVHNRIACLNCNIESVEIKKILLIKLSQYLVYYENNFVLNVG